MRRAPASVARTCTAAGALVAASLVWGAAAHGAGAQAPPVRRLTLAAQTPYVTAAPGDFALRLRIGSGSPAPTDIAVTIYRPVQTRSEFAETLRDRISRSAAAPTSVFPLAATSMETNGDMTVHVPVDLGADDGVYPVRVELRDRTGTALERFVTHLVYLAGSHTGPKLGLALVAPVRSSVTLGPDGPRQAPDLDDVVTSIAALEANRALPFTLDISPDTVAALDASDEERAGRALDSLRRLAVDHPLAGAPYAPLSLPTLLGPGLGDEITAQLSRGAGVLSTALRTRPDARVWIESQALDPESVDELVRRGVERVVASDAVLEPVPDLSLTLSRPFVLAGREEDVPAVVGDAGLSQYFNAEPSQVLQAQHLLADLAVVWLDAPATDRRAVVAMPPAGWRPTRAFLDTLSAALAQSPVAEAVSLDTVFTGVKPAITGRGSALVRHPANTPAPAMAEIAGEVRQARDRLTSLGEVLGAATPDTTLLDDRLLVAESAVPPTVKARQAYLSAVETGISDHLSAIQMPSGRSITLTARRGQIPVTFQNRTGLPAHVVVTVQSEKLEFPDGASRPLELARRNTTERFSVVSRTSGAFPLSITLKSPDGNLLIGQARLTVRSTATSRVSLAVSASAVVFLAVWWGRHIVRGRRARRLVPA